MNRVWIPSLALAAVLALPIGANAATKPSTAKAEAAVTKLVKFKYSGTFDGRQILTVCERDGARRWECTYGALKNAEDGFNDGLNGDDSSEIYAYKGTASVSIRKGSKLYKVRASRPESTSY